MVEKKLGWAENTRKELDWSGEVEPKAKEKEKMSDWTCGAHRCPYSPITLS